MRFGCRDSVEITDVVVIAESQLHVADDVLVFFLKHIGENPVIRLACGIIAFVMIHLIDEEQAQHLDALVEQLPLTLDMGKDCLPNLQAAQLLFADLTDNISGINLDPV